MNSVLSTKETSHTMHGKFLIKAGTDFKINKHTTSPYSTSRDGINDDSDKYIAVHPTPKVLWMINASYSPVQPSLFNHHKTSTQTHKGPYSNFGDIMK